MAYPPTVPPSSRTDASAIATHTSDHNTISSALTDIINKVAGSQVYVTSIGMSGPWTNTVLVPVPFKADILMVTTMTWMCSVNQMAGYGLLWDTTYLQYYADMWSNNAANNHITAATVNVLRGVLPGNHLLSYWAPYYNMSSDANDRAHHALTMVQVP